MTFDVDQVVEDMAKALKPHLWRDFAEKLARLSVFTPELAEESAQKKRDETMLDMRIVLPVAVTAVTSLVREQHSAPHWCHTLSGDQDWFQGGKWRCPTDLLLDEIEAQVAPKNEEE